MLAVGPNEVHPAGTTTEAFFNGPGIAFIVLNCDRRTRRSEFRVVKEVEELGAELQPPQAVSKPESRIYPLTDETFIGPLIENR